LHQPERGGPRRRDRAGACHDGDVDAIDRLASCCAPRPAVHHAPR
jgi:hypothetical protein